MCTDLESFGKFQRQYLVEKTAERACGGVRRNLTKVMRTKREQ